MSAAKHTPGPWKAFSTWVDGADGSTVAETGLPTTPTRLAAANAELIAAAPDLLAALRGMLDVQSSRDPFKEREAERAALAAIAKAEGRS